MPNSEPSHRQIAAIVGVSCATVSLALNNHPRISEATRKRVIEVATKLGYSPKAELLRVMTEVRRVRKEKPIIALPTNWDQPSPWNYHPFMKNFYRAVSQRAAELGYQIEEFWLGKGTGLSPKTLGRVLYTRNIPGLIIPPSFKSERKLPFDISSVAVATHGKTFFKPELSRAEPNALYNTMLALREIRKLGYRRIGFLHMGGISALHGDALELESAYSYYAQKGMLGTPIPVLFRNDYPLDGAPLKVLLNWIDEQKPDVILSNYPKMKTLLEANGISVPGQIGVVCNGVIPSPENTSGVDINSEVLDRLLVDVVVTQITCGQRGIPQVPVSMTVEGKWIKGETAVRVR